MRIVAQFDFNGGKDAVYSKYQEEYAQIVNAIESVDAKMHKTKVSKEKTMPGRVLYSPVEINKEFQKILRKNGWQSHKVPCVYEYGEYLEGYTPSKASKAMMPFRDMDFLKLGIKLGVEVQFGKYAFMVYNVCAKMTIFCNKGLIDTGIEMVPVKNFADNMSTGVSYFEQFA